MSQPVIIWHARAISGLKRARLHGLGAATLLKALSNSLPLSSTPDSRAIFTNRLNCSCGVSSGSLRFGIRRRFPLGRRGSPLGPHPLVSRSIGETPADDSLYRLFSASFIVNASCDPIIVPEIEFRKVAVQMALIAMLIDAFHAAFEDTEIAFESIG